MITMKNHRIQSAGMMCIGVALCSMLGCQTTTQRQSAGTDTLVNSEQDGTELGSFAVEGVSYVDVFEHAREVLASYRFGVNRVDGARGVLTTFPKRTVGIASPWDQEQVTIGQEWEDFANQQERVIRIEFDQGDTTDIDGDGMVRGRVEVIVSRVHRPHWRIEAESVRLSTHARSRDELGRVEAGEFREVIGRDDAFARKIAQAIENHRD